MRFKIVSTDDPNMVFETSRHKFALGRSKECEIVIEDPHISRVQARVRIENNRFYIENLGQNPFAHSRSSPRWMDIALGVLAPKTDK